MVKLINSSIRAVLLTLSLSLVLNFSMGSAKVFAGGTDRIVFFRLISGGTFEIFRMNFDGSEVTNLTNNPTIDIVPSWSPDGEKVIFLSYRDGASDTAGSNDIDIYTMNADGSNVEAVTDTDNNTEIGVPNWSPDGTKIAYTRISKNIYSGGGADNATLSVVVSNPDGSDLEEIYQYNYTLWSDTKIPIPIWSPDSSRVLFSAQVGGGVHLVSKDIYNMDEQQLTSGSTENLGRWSPDGTKIAFSSLDGSDWSLKVMDSDGSNTSTLATATSSGVGYIPTWSWDSESITYTKPVSGGYEFRRLNVDGSNDSALSDPSNAIQSPALFNSAETGFIYGYADGSTMANPLGGTIGQSHIYNKMLSSVNSTNLSGDPQHDNIGYFAVDASGIPGGTSNIPTAPKTGRIIGALVASAALMGIVFLISAEVKKKHHTIGYSEK